MKKIYANVFSPQFKPASGDAVVALRPLSKISDTSGGSVYVWAVPASMPAQSLRSGGISAGIADLPRGDLSF